MRVCFHGAESTGKTLLARKLGAEWGYPVVREYGRTYAETRGTDFTLDCLLEIARRQDRLMREAAAKNPPLMLLDTDPLMTAAWSRMLFDTVPDELLAYPKAELYLQFCPDVPWVPDGTRFFGTPELRAQFAAASQEMLDRTGVEYWTIAGDWDERERQVRAAVQSTWGTGGAA